MWEGRLLRSVGTIQRKWFLIVVLLLILGITGFGKDVLYGKDIVHIELECADLCKTMKTPPFRGNDYTFSKTDEVRIFQQAISKAVKMKDDLDYGVMFFMYLAFEDGTEKKFMLNVADEDERTALLVDTTDSGQGYEIPAVQTAMLRKIIYQTER
ncbi:hypothetical protein [Paenibacillus sp. R14(2021)]|uniref:hypothetical protein n=1 Tax=Paenibacillus sp. R14(2021) TaxID=2859228 RepID=UPI001C615DD2|nr:hypothetical protein [Paenibacillus sp. R14(2021)]